MTTTLEQRMQNRGTLKVGMGFLGTPWHRVYTEVYRSLRVYICVYVHIYIYILTVLYVPPQKKKPYSKASILL